MDDITFVRSHWWLVTEGFSLSTANSDVQKLPPLCTIVLQIPSLMPLKMRKVQQIAGWTYIVASRLIGKEIQLRWTPLGGPDEASIIVRSLYRGEESYGGI